VTTAKITKTLNTPAHRSNIDRYRKLVEGSLTDLESMFIQQRIAEEESAMHLLAGETFPIVLSLPDEGAPQAPYSASVSHPRRAVVRDVKSGDPLHLQQGRHTPVTLPNLDRLVAKRLSRFSQRRFIIVEQRNSRRPCGLAATVQQIKLIIGHARPRCAYAANFPCD
jgi:hypothetical protein